MGAGKPERAKKTMLAAMGLAFAFSVMVFALVHLFPIQIAQLFQGTGEGQALSPEVLADCIQYTAAYIQVISYDYLLTSILFCINGLAMGVGQTVFSMCTGHSQLFAAADPGGLYFRQRPGPWLGRGWAWRPPPPLWAAC